MVVKVATKVEEATVVARVAIAEAMAAKVATIKATAAVKAATVVAKVAMVPRAGTTEDTKTPPSMSISTSLVLNVCSSCYLASTRHFHCFSLL